MKRITLDDGELIQLAQQLIRIDCTDIGESIKIAKNFALIKEKAAEIEKAIAKTCKTQEDFVKAISELSGSKSEYEFYELNPNKFNSLTPAQAITISVLCQQED